LKKLKLKINLLIWKTQRWFNHSENFSIKLIQMEMVLFQLMKLKQPTKVLVEFGMLNSKLITILVILMEMAKLISRSSLQSAWRDKQMLKLKLQKEKLKQKSRLLQKVRKLQKMRLIKKVIVVVSVSLT